jgi:hypothetical protein
MLLQETYKAGDTISIKLSSGEELVAKLDSETSDDMVVEKPMILMATQQGAGLAPFMFTISPETKVTIRNKNVICAVKTSKEASDMYIQSTTGIQL